jgi:uncharacterized Zn-finger protein
MSAAQIERKPPMPIPPPETQIVTGWRVACDGSEGALGHPRVWLSLPHDTGTVDCGYCDKRFIHASVAQTLAEDMQPPG